MVNTVETALVILLAVGFVTLLVLAIILVSIMIAIMKNVKRISDRAEAVTSNAADIAAMVSQKLAPFAFSTAFAAALRRFRGKSK
jgi:hypothetical protein